MDYQSLINIFFGAILTAMGWFARELWDSVNSLKNDIRKIEVDLPTNYVRKIDIEARFDRLENILGKIFDRLEQKVDKQ